MKLLLLSTDQLLFEEQSEVRSRIAGYGRAAESVHVIVATRFHDPRTADSIATNVIVYPARGRNRFTRFVAMYRRASKLLASGGRWVVSSQDPFEIGLIGALLRVRFGIPLELQIHTDISSPYFRGESLMNRMRTVLGKLLLPHADSVRVVSERIREKIIFEGLTSPKKVFTLPVFVDPERFSSLTPRKPLSEKETVTLLIISRFAKEKNIGLAIRAVKKILSEYPRVRLRIIGGGPERDSIVSMVKEYELQEIVELMPWVDDVASEYRRADALLITSNYEGYGRTAVEAMLAGISVVMTDVGVAGSLVRNGETGFVSPLGSVEAFADTLREFLKNPKKTEAIRRAGLRAVSRLPRRMEYFGVLTEKLQSIRPKLCYVFPSYRDDDGTHFAYQAAFVKAVASEYDVRLIVEKGNPSENLGVTTVWSTEGKGNVQRKFRMAVSLINARISGYRNFYVHYSFFAAFLAKGFRGNVYYWNCGEPWKYKRSFLRNYFEQLTYRMINKLVTGTEGLKRAYSEHYQIPLSKIAVMPNWIDIEAFRKSPKGSRKKELREQLGISSREKIILFVHRLSKRKGALYLPEIIEKLNDPNAVFVIVGEGPNRASVEEKILKMNLSSRVRFIGSVPNRHLGDYYRAADIFLMPSEEEGFPHVLLEAMAFGVPFVASDVGGVKDIVPPIMYDKIIPQGATDQFTERLRVLLKLSVSDRRLLEATFSDWLLHYRLEVALGHFRDIIG